MLRVGRTFAAAMALAFAGAMIEAPMADAFAQTAKQTRAKKPKPPPRGAAVRQAPPAAAATPASSAYDRSSGGGGSGGGY